MSIAGLLVRLLRHSGLKRRLGDKNEALNPPQKPNLDEYHGKICAGQAESNPS